jgi:predicted site-specific integrase-resolvase
MSSAISTYNISGAAQAVGLPRTTVDAWVQGGVVRMTALINDRPAFSLADLEEIRRAKDLRDQARQVLRVNPTIKSS